MKICDIPDEEIPWFPTVAPEKCTGCRTCVEFCSHGTYEFDEADDIAKVAHPFNCVVGCTGCEPQCPAGAISFPPLTVLADLVSRKSCRSGGCGRDCGCGSCG